MNSTKQLEISVSKSLTILNLKKIVESNGMGEIAAQNLVVRGKVLADEKTVGDYLDVSSNTHKIYLAISSRSQVEPVSFDQTRPEKRSSPRPPSSPGPVPVVASVADTGRSAQVRLDDELSTDSKDDSERTCRICYSPEESPESGRLFSPCRSFGLYQC